MLLDVVVFIRLSDSIPYALPTIRILLIFVVEEWKRQILPLEPPNDFSW